MQFCLTQSIFKEIAMLIFVFCYLMMPITGFMALPLSPLPSSNSNSLVFGRFGPSRVNGIIDKMDMLQSWTAPYMEEYYEPKTNKYEPVDPFQLQVFNRKIGFVDKLMTPYWDQLRKHRQIFV